MHKMIDLFEYDLLMRIRKKKEGIKKNLKKSELF